MQVILRYVTQQGRNMLIPLLIRTTNSSTYNRILITPVICRCKDKDTIIIMFIGNNLVVDMLSEVSELAEQQVVIHFWR